jgi:c-di-GMP-binding flagellar brake protein YcgR
MNFLDISKLFENDIAKLINADRALFDGELKKVDDSCLGIAIKTNQKNYTILHTEQIIELIIAYEKEAFRCRAKIIGSKFTDSDQYILITKPEIILQIKRRDFERLPIVLEVKYAFLPPDTEYKKLSDIRNPHFRRFEKAYTIDISAGGIYIAASKMKSESNYALIVFTMDDTEIISLCYKLRTVPSSDGWHENIAFKYLDIPNEHRELIDQFVHKKLGT